MVSHKASQNPSSLSHQDHAPSTRSQGSQHRGTKVTQARAQAQRAKLDRETQARQQDEEMREQDSQPQTLQARRRARMTVAQAIADYLDDHIGGNHSPKTLEWHGTALGLLQTYLEHQREITLVGEIDSPDLVAWLTHLRKIPGARGKIRSDRTVQTYARSVRAFFPRMASLS